MAVFSDVMCFLLLPLLRIWGTFLAILFPSRRIPHAPEKLLNFIFSGNRLAILEYLTDAYFPFRAFWFERKVYVLDPKACMKVINKLDKGAQDFLSNSPLNSSFLANGARSPETRHAIAAIFRKSNMEEKGSLIAEVMKKTVITMKHQKFVNISEVSLKMALDVVGQVLLDLDLGALEGNQEKLLSAINTILHRAYALGEIEPDSSEFNEATKCLDRSAKKILTTALDSSRDGQTSFPRLLHAAGGFEEAADNLKLFLMAGSETTASGIPIFLRLLADMEVLQKELQNEADEFFDKVTTDASCAPPKLESAMKELLRTYAVAPFISRHTQDELVLDQFTLPPQTDIRVFTWGIQRSPNLWSPYSKDFLPNRFLGSNPGHSQQAYTWLPFGAGARICIGQHLARVELRVALTYFLKHFTFRKVGQTKKLNFCVDWEHAVVHPDCDVILGVESR